MTYLCNPASTIRCHRVGGSFLGFHFGYLLAFFLGPSEEIDQLHCLRWFTAKSGLGTKHLLSAAEATLAILLL